jgi:hypothetical protein
LVFSLEVKHGAGAWITMLDKRRRRRRDGTPEMGGEGGAYAGGGEELLHLDEDRFVGTGLET